MPDLAPTIPLLHGAAIPQLGLGTWPLDDAGAERVIAQAIEIGYRHIDTAENYRNEYGIGRGIHASGVAREDVFVTSKFNRRWHSVDGPESAWRASVDRLGLDYLDLLLIHWPNPDQGTYVDAWRGLTRLLDSGTVRAIGVSNFKPAHLDRIIDATAVIPDVNQIQLDPRIGRVATRAYDDEHGIVTTAYSPLGKGGDLLREPAITAAAERLGRTPGQVVLRWHVQQGLVAIPKSSDPTRLAQNLAVFDFAFSPDEMATITALDQGDGAGSDSDRTGH